MSGATWAICTALILAAFYPTADLAVAVAGLVVAAWSYRAGRRDGRRAIGRRLGL